MIMVKNLEWEKLKKMASNVSIIQLSELPDEFVAKIDSYAFKEDSNGRECFYLTLNVEGYGIVKQKFTAFQVRPLLEAFEKLGITPKNYNKKWYLWKKYTYRIGFPRWIPIKVVKNEKAQS